MTGMSRDPSAPGVSVVLCTFNRASLVGGALEALLDQEEGTPPYEIIVVDNNSTDRTREVVQRFAATGVVRYVHEPRQGLSWARNRGIAVARAPLVGFTDDDVRVSRTWVRIVSQTFGAHPDVDLVGGKVEPQWEERPPGWLADAGPAPLALADYGEEAFRIGPSRPVCLIGANVAVRRRAFDLVGGYSDRVQRVADGIGSTEDHEFQLRALAAGLGALYEPRMSARALVPADRLSKRYHRAWHGGHGRFYALMRDPAFERSGRGSLLGVPAHVYRSAAAEAGAWIGSLLVLRRSAAFAHELRLRFLLAFMRQRIFQGT